MLSICSFLTCSILVIRHPSCFVLSPSFVIWAGSSPAGIKFSRTLWVTHLRYRITGFNLLMKRPLHRVSSSLNNPIAIFGFSWDGWDDLWVTYLISWRSPLSDWVLWSFDFSDILAKSCPDTPYAFFSRPWFLSSDFHSYYILAIQVGKGLAKSSILLLIFFV